MTEIVSVLEGITDVVKSHLHSHSVISNYRMNMPRISPTINA